MSATLILALLLSTPAAADQDAFDRGIAAARAGRQDDAVAAYVEALESGAHDPAVYHGLGNALYRQEHLGPAIAAWTRGLQLAPTDGDLTANLALARRQTQDRIELPTAQTGPFPWQAALSAPSEVILAGLLCGIGLLLQLGTMVGRRRKGDLSLRPHVGGMVILALGLVMAVSAAVHARQLPPTTILVDQVAVRSALGAEGVELFLLHEGAVVRTIERYDNPSREDDLGAFVLIELPDARKGWVPASAVDVADPTAPFPLPQSAAAVSPQ